MFLSSAEAWLLLFTCAGIVAGFLLCAHLRNLKQKVPLFYYWLSAIAVLGGAAAFFLPIAINSGFGKNDDGSALRQALLYTTGGVLGVITLGETHRKNNQEKEKNENDHIRQVHAERRSRYTTAVEQLANEKATVRLGGIYTLVGLVDEWLTDGALKPAEQQKEGQTIIDNLCAYIRSPFPLAEKREVLESKKRPRRYKSDFITDALKFREEQETRRAIFTSISQRISKFNKDTKQTSPGLWSGFTFDFRESIIFYPLNNINIENPDFAGARFIGDADFQGSHLCGEVNLSNSVFLGMANFSRVIFNITSGTLHLETAGVPERFEDIAVTNKTFYRTKFQQSATFKESVFLTWPEFMTTTFKQDPDFDNALFVEGQNLRLYSRGMLANQVNLTTKDGSPTYSILPVGARLFDPSSWSNKGQTYTVVSKQAQLPYESSSEEN